MTTTRQPTKEESEARLEELELEYALAREGLQKAKLTITTFMLGAPLLIIWLSVFKSTLLTGTQITIIIVALIFAYVIYFAFVFGRVAKLKAEVSEKKKVLEMTAGEKVR